MQSIWSAIDPTLGVHPYPRIYLNQVRSSKASMFRAVQRKWPGCDIDYFITHFLGSETQRLQDEGYAHWLCMLPLDILDEFMSSGFTHTYGKPTLTGDMAYWAGLVYTEYQWEFGVYSKDLVQWAPPRVLASWFYPWHEASICALMQEFPFGCDHGR